MSNSTETRTEVSFDAGIPAGIWWRETRWRVLDDPTRLGTSEAVLYSSWITHPPEPWSGWRFTARSEADGDVLVFDVKEFAPGEFEVLRVYA